MARDQRDLGLSESDRNYVIRKKFGLFSARKVKKILLGIENPSDKVLGAVLFLARPKQINDVISSVNLANESEKKLLEAAQVKMDRV
ncbi:hypothetical protein [Zooshikella ganghwensis]|uniref:Uncharacterized protein n=1 Tax=Zooshikella ganghwensis TaxID=202772 RepID=A0A4P9VRZ0_9GAMM|nr:hypothetical protein [Zooshikella ganghwensis]RDH45846.1 hypothetical protein B9G39_21665 [Zooshikella ganghwensis]